ncbi:MAG: hypothetical protein IJH43_01115 [Mogibacterium sp.]|nr:hypothetical protein [Mogibacterium sp.]
MNNMQIVEKLLLKELDRCKNLHYRFAKRLGRLASSPVMEVLSYTEKNGVKYYSEVWYEEGERNSLYLGTDDNAEVRHIKEKHFLRKAVKDLEKKIKTIEGCIKKLSLFSSADINECLPKTYRLKEEQLNEIEGPTEEEDWYKSALRVKAFRDKEYGIRYAEGRKHTTKDGIKMRSKSEVSIGNEFLARGKKYIYELPVFIGGVLLHPDFAFFSERFGRMMFWEHVGILGDEGYMEDFSQRMDTYTKGGMVPCVDVIFTFDDIDGNLDTRLIQRLLDEYA